MEALSAGDVFGLLTMSLVGLVVLWAVIAIVGKPGPVVKWLGGMVLFAVVVVVVLRS